MANTLPNATPWGTRDYTERVTDGVYWVGTPSHGGLAVDVTSVYGADAISAARRSNYSFLRNGFAWLEEDCDGPSFVRAHPELGV